MQIQNRIDEVQICHEVTIDDTHVNIIAAARNTIGCGHQQGLE